MPVLEKNQIKHYFSEFYSQPNIEQYSLNHWKTIPEIIEQNSKFPVLGPKMRDEIKMNGRVNNQWIFES